MQSLGINAGFYSVPAGQPVYTFKCGPDPPGTGHLGSMTMYQHQFKKLKSSK